MPRATVNTTRDGWRHPLQTQHFVKKIACDLSIARKWMSWENRGGFDDSAE